MAERKQVNKYYPPDYDPSKGSLNQYIGQHPLRERARKLDQGILIIRFEVPWDFWCDGCKAHIAKGVRFNAEKLKVGKYLTTTIWQFSMTCHLCSNRIIFRTDPEHSEYLITKGGKQKMETYSSEDTGVIDIPDAVEKSRLDNDPMYRLEHISKDKKKADEYLILLQKLQQIKSVMHYDYNINKEMRKQFREMKKEQLALEKEAKSKGLGIILLPVSDVDQKYAEKQLYKPKRTASETKKQIRYKINNSIFPISKSSESKLKKIKIS